MNFDSRGFLKPYEPITCTLQELEENFVEKLDNFQHRSELFANYLRYIDEFQSVVKSEFEQWLNGSFTTRKHFPNDIDLVNFIDFQIVSENETALRTLSREIAFEKYRVDSNIVRLFPFSHPKHSFTQSDKSYWHHQFGFTAKNKNGKRYPKGFLKIIVK